jgi:hypothetical protein
MKIVLLWLTSTIVLGVYAAQVDKNVQLVPGYGMIVTTSLCKPNGMEKMDWDKNILDAAR